MMQDMPNCVFCGVPWSAEMLRLYEAASSGAPCACCAPFMDEEAWEPPPATTPAEHIVLPPELCCTACGRVLYHLATPIGLDDIAPRE
jgi:hypothetical protein